jgi:RNA polymerase sigma-70 factor (ECF subfamily)
VDSPREAASGGSETNNLPAARIVLIGKGQGMSDESDARLIARLRSGDESALNDILGRYEVPLFQFLYGILRHHHQAEDALQETLVRALEHLDGVDGDHLRGWLFTVAYHQAMLVKRRQKKQLTSVDEQEGADLGPGPLLQVEKADDARRLRELLEQLPPGQREVIRQRVYEGKRFREIAETLNCPLNTALARMHEGLKRLRLLWEQSHA